MNEIVSTADDSRVRSRIRRAWASMSSPRWAPILLKVALGAGAMMLLAFIGGRARPSAGADAEQIAAADLAIVVSTAVAQVAAASATTAAGTAAPHAAAEALPVGCEGTAVGPGCATAPGMTAEGKVILNVASVETLITLPGVGPARAQAIVDLRERLGRFRRIEDLLRIRGIGPRSLNKLRPLVVLDQPSDEE